MEHATNGVEVDERIQPLAVLPHTKYEQVEAAHGGFIFCAQCNRLAKLGDAHACTPQAQKADEPALRYDAGKVELAPAITYVDDGFLAEVGQAFTYGAQKYGRDNWKKGMSWSRCLNSCLRHVYKWWRGERIDPESGCHHLALATCSIMFLFVYERDNLGKDDR